MNKNFLYYSLKYLKCLHIFKTMDTADVFKKCLHLKNCLQLPKATSVFKSYFNNKKFNYTLFIGIYFISIYLVYLEK